MLFKLTLLYSPLPSGSANTIRTSWLTDFRKLPIPEIVPPVPAKVYGVSLFRWCTFTSDRQKKTKRKGAQHSYCRQRCHGTKGLVRTGRNSNLERSFEGCEDGKGVTLPLTTSRGTVVINAHSDTRRVKRESDGKDK